MVASVEKELLGTPSQTAEPLQEFSLQPGEEYEITVVASNAIGNSSESNSVSFVAPSGPVTTTELPTTIKSPTATDTTPMSLLDTLLYIPIVVTVAAIAIVILLVVVFIAGYGYKSEFSSHVAYVGSKPLYNVGNF